MIVNNYSGAKIAPAAATPTPRGSQGTGMYSTLRSDSRFVKIWEIAQQIFRFLVKQDWFRKPIWKELESVAFPYLLVNVYHPVQYNPRAIFIFGGAERKTIRIHPSIHPVQRSSFLLSPSPLICFRLAVSYPRSFWTNTQNCLSKKNQFATTMWSVLHVLTFPTLLIWSKKVKIFEKVSW